MLDLILASLRDVALALREGKVTSVELVEEYLGESTLANEDSWRSEYRARQHSRTRASSRNSGGAKGSM